MCGQVLQTFTLLVQIGFQRCSKLDVLDSRLGNNQPNVESICLIRLRDIIVRTRIEDLLEVLFSIARGPDQNQMPLSFRLAANPSAERKSIHARQEQVEE